MDPIFIIYLNIMSNHKPGKVLWCTMPVLRIVSSSPSFQSTIHESPAIPTDSLGRARYWGDHTANMFFYCWKLEEEQVVFSSLSFMSFIRPIFFYVFFLGASGRYSSCFRGVCRTTLVSRRVTDFLKNRCCKGATADDGEHKWRVPCSETEIWPLEMWSDQALGKSLWWSGDKSWLKWTASGNVCWLPFFHVGLMSPCRIKVH